MIAQAAVEKGVGGLLLFDTSSSELLSLCLASSAVDFGCVSLCSNEHMLKNMLEMYVSVKMKSCELTNLTLSINSDHTTPSALQTASLHF